MVVASDIMEGDFITADSEDAVSTLVGKFRKKNITDAVVLTNGHFEGILRKRSFLRLKQNISLMKVKNFITKVPELKPGMAVEEIPALMDSADTHLLPVIEKERVMGVVAASSLLFALKELFRGIKIFELLKEAPIVLDGESEISKAINYFREKRIDHLPVVDENKKLMGVVSVSDLIMKYYIFPPKREQRFGRRLPASHTWKQENLAHLPIKNEISQIIYSADRNDSVINAIGLLKDKKISSLIITDNEEVVGIITLKDLLKLYGEIKAA